MEAVQSFTVRFRHEASARKGPPPVDSGIHDNNVGAEKAADKVNRPLQLPQPKES